MPQNSFQNGVVTDPRVIDHLLKKNNPNYRPLDESRDRLTQLLEEVRARRANQSTPEYMGQQARMMGGEGIENDRGDSGGDYIMPSMMAGLAESATQLGTVAGVRPDASPFTKFASQLDGIRAKRVEHSNSMRADQIKRAADRMKSEQADEKEMFDAGGKIDDLTRTDRKLGQGDYQLGQGDRKIDQGDRQLGQADRKLGQGDYQLQQSDRKIGQGDRQLDLKEQDLNAPHYKGTVEHVGPDGTPMQSRIGEHGEILGTMGGKPKAPKLPLSVETKIRTLSRATANQAAAAIDLDKMLANMKKYMEAGDEDQATQAARMTYKMLNAQINPDAVGVEEGGRIGDPFINYKFLNLWGTGPVFGRDLPEFYKQATERTNAIKDAIRENNKMIRNLESGSFIDDMQHVDPNAKMAKPGKNKKEIKYKDGIPFERQPDGGWLEKMGQ